jgi:hypothetical protein
MTRRPRALLPLLLALLALAVAGCQQARPRMKPLRFNNKIAERIRKIADEAKKFRSALEEKPADLPNAYLALEKAVNDAVADADKLSPPKSTNGADVLARYKAFLETEKALLSTVNQIRNGNTDPRLFEKIRREEEKAWAALREAQQAYAKEFNLRLVG